MSPEFIDLLDESQCHYYDGCLVFEIQDFRGKTTEGAPTVRKVLMRPDIEAIIHDVEQMCTKSGREWSQDEKMAIEQKILMAMYPTLCLNPSVRVAIVTNLMSQNKYKFNSRYSKGM